MPIADQALVKKINQKLILNEILNNSPISRATLSEVTGLNKSTVSSQVNELIEKDFIFEIGTGQSRGGRKPVMLVFNKNAGYSIGIDIGVDYINGVMTDLEGNIILEKSSDFSSSSSSEVKEILLTLIRDFISRMPNCPYGLVGIGICIPGLINCKQEIISMPNSEWYIKDLKHLIENEFHVPVFIENEANAGAYGEKVFGTTKNYENIIYISINIGIGLGIILDNELYKGVNGFSGEMGHMTIDFNGPKCSCGNRGCWELYASEKALLASFSSVEEKNEKNLVRKEIIERANKNDVDALNALQNFGFYISIGITNILNTFDTQAIILRNNIIESHPIVLNTIKNEVASRVHSHLENTCELLPSSLGKNAPALGAVSIVINHFLNVQNE
ncbi:ROK family protein [Priestia flexa]|uniref:ROK family transcriptional regulator n=1 Tax=Priestia flexa TaxID=86664 RepID=A0A8I1MFF7_9BACI|nr:ROK family transcriptional regulator [Priestia flexa]MBN8252180.1 ROK family transcriptional regulator [Priestia flexa]MBN8435125.1 ROK family transcriptional regulator [Priestia flexa]MCA0967373.1 ROK family protein [Priestia flexa]UIR32198.1 ROK family protein [Priestia flexa]